MTDSDEKAVEVMAMVSVPLEDLQRFLERARWTPPMLNVLSADEYRKTLEAEIRLRHVLYEAQRAKIARIPIKPEMRGVRDWGV